MNLLHLGQPPELEAGGGGGGGVRLPPGHAAPRLGHAQPAAGAVLSAQTYFHVMAFWLSTLSVSLLTACVVILERITLIGQAIFLLTLSALSTAPCGAAPGSSPSWRCECGAASKIHHPWLHPLPH